MPAKRLSMRQIREVLRLKHACGMSVRQIADALGIGRTTVSDYLRRLAIIDLSWPLPVGLSDTELEDRLFPRHWSHNREQPDWSRVHAELKKPGVTLLLLWEEYRKDNPDGYAPSRFYELYRQWLGRVSPVMRQTHLAGEKLFVDYAGHTVEIIDGMTGEVRDAQIFVAAVL